MRSPEETRWDGDADMTFQILSRLEGRAAVLGERKRITTEGAEVPQRERRIWGGKDWQSWVRCDNLLRMGNKDARNREKKKPKKKEPKVIPLRRGGDQMTTRINTTPNYPGKGPGETP